MGSHDELADHMEEDHGAWPEDIDESEHLPTWHAHWHAEGNEDHTHEESGMNPRQAAFRQRVQAFLKNASGYDGEYDIDDHYDDDGDFDDNNFADPGGGSALRAAGPRNPRNIPCPTCKRPNKLTPADEARGYQCDSCADRAERGYD
jgi:hypothetical protein